MMINFKIKIIIRIESKNLTKESRYTMFSNIFLAGIGTLYERSWRRNFAHMISFVILYLYRIIIYRRKLIQK